MGCHRTVATYDLQEFGARAAPIAPALLFMSFLLIPAANEMFWRVVYDLARTIGFDAGGAAWGLRLFQFWR